MGNSFIRLVLGRELRNLALSLAGIFSLASVRAGAAIGLFAALGALLGRPAVLVGGLLCFSLLRLMEALTGRAADLRLMVNALLLGMGVGFAYEPRAAFALLTAAAAAFTLLFGAQCIAWADASGLPVLSLPFATGYILLQLAAPLLGGVASPLATHELDLCPAIGGVLPDSAAAFLRSLSWLLFTPDVAVGLALLVVILCCSRQLVFHGLWAFVVATTLLAAWHGNPDRALHHPGGFNFTLVGLVVGATFLRPSWRSLLWSTLAVSVATFLAVALSASLARFGSTPSTLPFVLVTLLTIGLLRRADSALLPLRIAGTPEQTAAEHEHVIARFGRGPALELPFSVPVRVYQAFDGPWTHQGIWRCAYDFVRDTETGRSHRESGLELADYPLFGLVLRAPCDGEVVACRDDLADNQPGWINHSDNWGNYIILRREDGLHVEMSHLRQFSIRVKKGEVVKAGQPLAQCGNSGYSLYPHLHLQVQVGAWLAEPTLPFTFRCLRYQGRLHHECLPPVGAEVAPVEMDDAQAWPRFTLGESLRFRDQAPGRPDRTAQWKVERTLDAFGRTYLSDLDGNILYYTLSQRGYVALSYHGHRDAALALFARALPRLPNVADSCLWRDRLSFELACGPIGREWRGLASAYGWASLRRRAQVEGVWRFQPRCQRVIGRAAGLGPWSVHFGSDGLTSIAEGTRTLTRLP
jgi:murein DD-endopeptidase MepM/ murein hydrolase activator NlpD